MPIVEWNNSYATGIKQFDEDHEHLVTLLNKTFDAFIAHETAEKLGKILLELMAYSEYHFEEEERWMQKFGFPFLTEHAMQHEEFSREMVAFHKDFIDGNELIAPGILTYLKDWLVHHILHSDAKFAQFDRTAMVPGQFDICSEFL